MVGGANAGSGKAGRAKQAMTFTEFLNAVVGVGRDNVVHWGIRVPGNINLKFLPN